MRDATVGNGGAPGTGGAAGSGGMGTGGKGGVAARDAGMDAAPDAMLDAAPDAAPEAGPPDAAPDGARDAAPDAMGDGAPPPPPPVCDNGHAVATTFTGIYTNLLSVTCAVCHSMRKQGTGTMPLQFPPNMAFDQGVDLAYEDLVTNPSSQGYACGPANLQRVVAGDPAHSLIIEKLQGKFATGGPVCGAQMPFGQPPLCQPIIDGIKTWIMNGAKKD